MFDFTWGDGGVTIYWPSNPTTTYPGQVPAYPVYTQQPTRISTGTLILGAIVIFLLLKK